MNKLSIRDLPLKGKRVFVRVDFNVPMTAGKVDDDTRIRETIPTLRLAIEKGARIRHVGVDITGEIRRHLEFTANLFVLVLALD